MSPALDYRAILGELREGCQILDREWRYLYINKAALEQVGRKEADLIQRTMMESLPGIEATPLFSNLTRCMREGKSLRFEAALDRPSHGPVWLDIAARPLPEGLLILSIDVAGPKRSEPDPSPLETRQDVSETEAPFQRALLEQMMENIPDKVYFKDRRSQFLQISRAQANAFGLRDPNEAIGKTDFDYFDEVHAREAYDDEQAIMRTGTGVVNKEELEVWPDGRKAWASTTKMPFRNLRGEIIGTFGISRDITDRKRFEDELAFQRALLDQLMENVPDYIYFKDRESRFIRISKSHALAFNLSEASQAVGRSDADFFASGHAGEALEDERTVMRTGVPIINKEEHERTTDGRDEWMLTTKMPFRDARGDIIGTFGISRNIADLKRTELELRRRLEQLEVVSRISTTTRSAHTLEEMLPALLDMTRAVMGFSRGAIWLYDPFENRLRLRASLGYEEPRWQALLATESEMAGSASLTFMSGNPNIVVDLHTDDRIPEAVRSLLRPGTFSLSVALRATDDVVIGTLSMSAEPPRAIDSGDVSLLTTISDIAGSAIHRTRLHEQTEERLRQVAGLREIDKAITTSFDLHRNLQTVLSQVIALLKGDAAIVFIANIISGELEPVAVAGEIGKAALATPYIRFGEGMAGRAALERKTLCERIDRLNPESARASLAIDQGFGTATCAPLIAKGQVKGVLEVLHHAPIQPTADWLEFFEALAGQAAIVIENSALFESALRSKDELTMAYDATIEGWSRALDLRDKETEGHSQRVTIMTCRMAKALGMGDEDLARVRWGALLHDIGKMDIPDAILLKPGPLSDEEWVIMRKHPTFAFEMLAPIEYLKSAIDIPYCHHEKWDGSGYPRGLKGDQIPVSARLFAVVDVWDALTSDRPYRPAWSAERVKNHLLELSGSHFDPRAVEIFLEVVGTNGNYG